MNPRAAVAALITGCALAALVHGAWDGPRWLLLVGLNLTVLILVVLDLTERVDPGGAALPLRPGGRNSYAPAVVHGTRAVHRDPRLTARDARSPDTAFEFDLTVLPDARPPYRIKVRYPLDLQNARERGVMVVEYDTRQPWRVAVPPRPPSVLAARAVSLGPPEAEAERVVAPRRAPRVLVGGAVVAAVLLALVRFLG
ncbi:hypothetical protein [Streptomyces halstedii]|uniref:hypothetical protein n=1 Tax=Streptomyces halstedii TaxID=1944 RepID=UPI00335B27F7